MLAFYLTCMMKKYCVGFFFDIRSFVEFLDARRESKAETAAWHP
jgi:hypothetical protein